MAPRSRDHSLSKDLINSSNHGGGGQDIAPAVCAGDRTAMANFLQEYGPLIRRRLRGKLSPAMRRLFDSQEILSTIGRRLDQLVASGRLHATTDSQVWSLVFTIAENSLLEKARVFRHLQAKEGADSPLAEVMLAKMRESEQRAVEGPELELDHALRSLGDRVDRQVLSLWLMGRSAKSIGAATDMKIDAVYQRWHRIRGQLRKAYETRSI